MDIKILVATHKSYWMPTDNVYLPVHVGKEGKEDIGFIGDNTGDNISTKNANYCELTGLYWAWKNISADYIGLCHYRRYFTRANPINCEKKKQVILSRNEWEKLLEKHPIIVPDKRKYYIETNRSHYNHSHYAKDIDTTEKIIQEKYPQYINAFTKVMKRTWAHMFNMFVMRKDYLNEYCTWLFDVLQELENRTDITNYNVIEARIYGYISELLLDVWLETKQYEYYEQNVAFLEPQNWIKKGGIFLRRKIMGK
ncbi:DUF4422 domain-containing protein [Anaerovibrio lipolyticus]|uniref:DUF4422 domain-containing protein n=1 Tax=Anaerovibrio lipolyticus TaxID=82374 RepID=UPI001F215D99|nr:DUF4422 domain-containing protein [Anaerovibrio lipolyticus]